MIRHSNGKYWEEYNFADRNFKIGDRVQTFFEGKWYKGKIIDKYLDGDWSPDILIETDKKVKNGEILNGYGIWGPVHGRDPTFFEKEPLPSGDEIYRRIIKRYLTKKEIREEKNYEVPF
jgi:hypothetical protein